MKQKRYNMLIISMLLLIISACGSGQKQESNTTNPKDDILRFNLDKPAKKIKLPAELREISALSYYKDNLVACLQDEDGIIYLIDFDTEEIAQKIKIAGKGDFEGIETIGDTAYMMKSKGKIIRIKNFMEESPEIEKYDLGFGAKNDCEGLGFNAETNELLIACKGRAELPDDIQKNIKLPELKKYRAVYTVNRKNMKLNIKPKYLLEKTEYEKISRTDDFKPSAIAVQPKTNNLYILASAGKLLVVIDKYGNYLTHKQLNPKQFIQPEGICFSPDGKKLFIANEGKGGKGTILIFESF